MRLLAAPDLPEARSLIDAGKLRSLAVMGANRAAPFPTEPTLKAATAWRGSASALLIVATVLADIALADQLGFLLVAPLCLLAAFRVLGSGLGRSHWPGPSAARCWYTRCSTRCCVCHCHGA